CRCGRCLRSQPSNTVDECSGGAKTTPFHHSTAVVHTSMHH
ncbi:hypothetical protein TSMEX_000898, partial [Taenia solium]